MTYVGQHTIDRGEKRSFVARVAIDGGRTYSPSLNQFKASGQIIGEPSVKTSWRGDVYLSLVEKEASDGRAAIRVVVQPLVVWLWVGGTMMFLGSLLAAFPGKRRRVPTSPTSAPVSHRPDPERVPHRPEGEQVPLVVG